MIGYTSSFSILAVLFLVASIPLFILSYNAYEKELASRGNETNAQSLKNFTGTNIRSNPQTVGGSHENFLAAGIVCIILWILFTFLAIVFHFNSPGSVSEDPSTDENPSEFSRGRTDAIVRGAAERLSAGTRYDPQGMPNEPPDVSSSDETCVLFRNLLGRDLSPEQKERILNKEAGGSVLRERRISRKDLTNEEGERSSAEVYTASIGSSRREQSMEESGTSQDEACKGTFQSSSEEISQTSLKMREVKTREFK